MSSSTTAKPESSASRQGGGNCSVRRSKSADTWSGRAAYGGGRADHLRRGAGGREHPVYGRLVEARDRAERSGDQVQFVLQDQVGGRPVCQAEKVADLLLADDLRELVDGADEKRRPAAVDIVVDRPDRKRPVGVPQHAAAVRAARTSIARAWRLWVQSSGSLGRRDSAATASAWAGPARRREPPRLRSQLLGTASEPTQRPIEKGDAPSASSVPSAPGRVPRRIASQARIIDGGAAELLGGQQPERVPHDRGDAVAGVGRCRLSAADGRRGRRSGRGTPPSCRRPSETRAGP